MYHVSQAVSFIVVGTRALGRSRHRLVLDTRRNEIHIGEVLSFLWLDAACLDLRKMFNNGRFLESYFTARYLIPKALSTVVKWPLLRVLGRFFGRFWHVFCKAVPLFLTLYRIASFLSSSATMRRLKFI
jgi:hypothetical protein